MKNLHTAYIILLLALLASCHRKHAPQATKKEAAKEDKTITELAAKLATPNYKWIRSRGKADIETGDKEFSAGFLLKMRKDSIVYGTANVIFEVGRALITRDSATVVNLFQKQYATVPTAQAQSLLGIEGLSLESMQRLLIGLPPFPIDGSYTVKAEGSSYIISKTGPTAKEDMELDAATMRLKSYSIAKNASEAVKVTYDQYAEANGLMLPGTLRLETPAPNKNVLLLSFQSHTLTDWDEVRFTVPSGYGKMAPK